MNGKYCLDMGHDYEEVKRANSKDNNHPLAILNQAYSPSTQVEEIFREQCVFEALQGQKSHWFRFMDILIDGCVK